MIELQYVLNIGEQPPAPSGTHDLLKVSGGANTPALGVMSSGWHPLAPNHDNAFNPNFLSLLFCVNAVVFSVVCLSQLVRFLRRERYGSSLNVKSVGVNQWIRVNSVTLQSILYFILASETYYAGQSLNDVKVYGFLGTAMTILFVVLPLHFVEPTASTNASGTLLFFWPLLSILQSVVLVQQLYSPWKVIANDSPTLVLTQVMVLLNGLSIIVSEAFFWKSSEHLIFHNEVEMLPTNTPNVYEKLTFTWMNPLITLGYKKQSLSEADLPNPPADLSTNLVASWLQVSWAKQMKRVKPSLLLALINVFGVSLILTCIYEFINTATCYIQPQLLRLLIKFFAEDNEQPILVGFLIAASMFSVSIIEYSLFNQFSIKIFQLGLSCKASLMSLVFNKAMKLSAEAKTEKSTGDIVNMMSVDVGRIQDMCQQFSMLITGPTDLILCLTSLYYLLGKSTIGGILVMAIMIPLNSVLVRSMKSLHKQQMVYKDSRTRTINEILSSIKSIKLYSWETPMLEKLSEVRNNQELRNLTKIGVYSACVNFAWNCVPFFVSCTTFTIFALTENKPLSSEIVFPALSLFNLLSGPLFAVPSVINSMIETSVALGRLTSFLLCSELDPELVRKLPKVQRMGREAIRIENATFLWSKVDSAKENYDEESTVDKTKVALKNINYSATKGDLACIVGRVGSGKSTFMQALLGQLVCISSNPIVNPTIDIRGTIAYCSQVPWIMNASVKDNILFGHRYEGEFYQKTIEACELLSDLEILPDGDETQVGEKGISLSGGQKARLSLARAVYARADIYLFDDILSAVDAHVGQSLIDKVLGSHGLLSSKTRILATNSVPVLSHSKNIILLAGGEIVERGTFDEVKENRSALYELIKEFGREDSNVPSFTGTISTTSESTDVESESVLMDTTVSSDEFYEEVDEFDGNLTKQDGKVLDMTEDTISLRARRLSHVTLRRASIETLKRKPIVNPNKDDEADTSETPVIRTAQLAETSKKGKVKWSVYKAYASACSLKGVALFMVMMVLTTATSVAGNYWLKHWAEENSKTGTNANVWKFVGVYAIFGIGAGLFTLIRTITMWVFCSIRGSRVIHDNMAATVLRAPMSFFETTPIGRIMNRFSNDVNKIDENLPRVFAGFFTSGIKTVFTLGVVGFAMPSFLAVILLLSLLYIYYQRYYIAVSREVKRIVSVSRSPIFAHLQETLTGVDTIRAYGQQNRFTFINTSNIDFNLKALYILRSTNRWLAFRLQFIGSIMIFAASTLAISSIGTKRQLSAGMVGLVMSYALQVTDSLNWIVRMTVEVETSIVCVERCLEYCELKPEADAIVEDYRPSANWPSDGSVSFVNYSTKYRENLDPVLNDISLEIKPREKIGIVGRTGAGKSSLALAIFRLIEPTAGHISIDGINTSEIGLYDLRHKLSIIPQDSQAFEGTVRQNLDPLAEHSDDELWSVLELAHLKEHVKSMSEEGLLSPINESGSNLSVGQRQLMCLARALLNPSTVLILDEATAAVDVQTDQIVQETIRKEFKDKTILTIAHRLDTVMDSDRIVVLDKGRIIEFDSPETLLSNKQSAFYGLCDKGGYLKNN